MSARCTKRLPGPHGLLCNGPLVVATNGAGVVVTRCLACERQSAGLCQGCPSRIATRTGRWCEPCLTERRRHSDRIAKQQPAVKKKSLKRNRERYRTNPAFRARRLEALRAWQANNVERRRKYARAWQLADGPQRQKRRDYLLEYRYWKRAERDAARAAATTQATAPQQVAA